MRLRYKIAIYFTLIITVVLTFSALITLSRVGETLKQSGLTSVAGAINIIRGKVEDQLSSYSDFVRNLSLSGKIREDFFKEDWKSLERRLGSHFFPVKDVFKNGFFVLDRDGTLVSDFPPSPGVRGKNFSFRPYFRDCRLKKKVVISPPYFSARTGKKVLTFAAPFLDDAGNFSGLIAASVQLEDTELVKSISEIRLFKTGKVGLFTDDGEPIYSPFGRKHEEAGESSSAKKGGESSSIEFSRHTGARGKVIISAVTHLPQSGWVLEARVPEDELYLPLKKLTNSFVAIILSAMALAFGASVFLSHAIVSRIERLKEGLAEMEVGADKFPQITAEGGDEIAELIQVFNRMSQELGNKTRELKESQELFKSVISSINEYIYRVEVTEGRKFRTVLVTDRAKDITGYEPEEFKKNYKLWLEIVHPEDRGRVLRDFVREVLHREQYTATYRIIHRDGSVKYIQNSVRTIFDEMGNPVSLNGTVVDMTEKILLEQQLQQAQKIRAIGMLAGGIAHDFNNILSSILGYVSMLKERLSSNPELEAETKRALAIIESSAERGAELTRQLLGFAMKGKFTPRVVDLNELVKENIEMVKRTIGKNITVTGQFDEDLPCIKADPSQITQVLMNLCINARDAMPDGGELTIQTKKNPSIPFEFKNSFKNCKHGVVLLSVRDTGVGMEEEVLSRAFEPFFTTKEPGKGTGLGLSTVYGIIKNHGGEIQIESRPGKGTEVKIYLPATGERAVEEKPEVALARDEDREMLNIMVVDDEVFVREFLTEAIKSFGHRVIECSSGAEALSVYEEEDERIDLVILDMLMPGMDGKETMSRLKKKDPGVKVIIASGYLPDEDAEELAKMGVDALLRKPFRIEELRKAIEQVKETINRPA